MLRSVRLLNQMKSEESNREPREDAGRRRRFESMSGTQLELGSAAFADAVMSLITVSQCVPMERRDARLRWCRGRVFALISDSARSAPIRNQYQDHQHVLLKHSPSSLKLCSPASGTSLARTQAGNLCSVVKK